MKANEEDVEHEVDEDIELVVAVVGTSFKVWAGKPC